MPSIPIGSEIEIIYTCPTCAGADTNGPPCGTCMGSGEERRRVTMDDLAAQVIRKFIEWDCLKLSLEEEKDDA